VSGVCQQSAESMVPEKGITEEDTMKRFLIKKAEVYNQHGRIPVQLDETVCGSDFHVALTHVAKRLKRAGKGRKPVTMAITLELIPEVRTKQKSGVVTKHFHLYGYKEESNE